MALSKRSAEALRELAFGAEALRELAFGAEAFCAVSGITRSMQGSRA
jgi:hypothetical protein